MLIDDFLFDQNWKNALHSNPFCLSKINPEWIFVKNPEKYADKL